MKLVTRAQWGARPPKAKLTLLRKGHTSGVAVHYEAVEGPKGHAKCDDRVRSIQRYHQEEKDWNDIAYSFLFCDHGYVFEGRGWGVRTAAQGSDSGNDQFHAACYLGDDDKGFTDLTPEAASALIDVINDAKRLGWGTEVRPHSAFSATACPGTEIRAWIQKTPWKASSRPVAGTAIPSWFTRTIWPADPGREPLRGADVEVVQRKLQVDPVDGVYWHATASKVRGFQQLNGLQADGVVGIETAKRLGE